MDEDAPPPVPAEQQNEEIIFFTSCDAHTGHFVSCPEACMLWSSENRSLHFRQIYS